MEPNKIEAWEDGAGNLHRSEKEARAADAERGIAAWIDRITWQSKPHATDFAEFKSGLVRWAKTAEGAKLLELIATEARAYQKAVTG